MLGFGFESCPAWLILTLKSHERDELKTCHSFFEGDIKCRGSDYRFD